MKRWWAVLVVAAVLVGTLAWSRWGSGGSTVTVTGTLPVTRVLLIPGHGGSTDGLETLRTSLAAAGFAPEVVDIGDGGDSITVYAQQVAARAAGASPVALVGYSQGGLIARAAAALAPTAVARVVTIGTPHAGTSLAQLGANFLPEQCNTSCQEMVPGSDFLQSLPGADDPSRWLAIRTSDDDVVQPADSAALDGATNVDVRDLCPGRAFGHQGVVSAQTTALLVTQFLQSGTVGAGSC